MPAQANLDNLNAEFWNELCGSGLAKSLGLCDHSAQSLRRFDDAHLALYPYLPPIIRPERMAGKKVLEIGLGYGTLGQQIRASGIDDMGLDIAPNPWTSTSRPRKPSTCSWPGAGSHSRWRERAEGHTGLARA